MKKNMIFFCLAIFLTSIVQAQSDYRVVFDLTSRDSLDQKAALRWAGEVANVSPETRVEVVMYGQGVHMMVKEKSTLADAITGLIAKPNVSFKVCAVALKAQKIDKSQLFPGVEVVPDGIYEIISKQRDGWGYIKAVH